MLNSRNGLTAIIFTLALTICTTTCAWAQGLQSFQNLEGKIDIAGGTAHIPVMKDAAEAIMKANPKIRITVAGGGSGVGVQKVGEGLVDIGNTGRPLTPAEVDKYGLKTFPFAIDGVAVAVNPKNPVGALTSQQVRDIFAGKKITYPSWWSQDTFKKGPRRRKNNPEEAQNNLLKELQEPYHTH